MERLKAYQYRIYPTEEQEIFFAKSFDCVRKVYNLMLDNRKKAYEETKSDPFKKMNFPKPTKYKKNFRF
ncbi:helix-turn-helix domain-containing protein [Macrococcus caseolyticus]|uniref:helix-turn-helix domain-containing protein n=1 Tax=Macrococcoides caseolyticum TaxID=69966 RepID=UPI001E64C88A|nr:helix-turn-helix domain-containing protein [Macrococcus caseolyticus]